MRVPAKALLVYSYIVQYKMDHDGNSPYYREIADALGYKGPGAIQYYIHILNEAGMVKIVDSRLEIGGKYTPPKDIGVHVA